MCVRSRLIPGRVALVFVLVLTFAAAANAYTVVMRDGRRVEIPARFELTKSTLTYEVSTGIQITLQLAAIDIAATEKANNESPGGFLKRLESNSVATAAPKSATRTITNRDLESTAQRRRASESAYDKRRRELGLPSVEESRRRAAAESEIISAQLQENRAVEAESETYWRTRAAELRTEIAAVDSQLNYYRRQLEESPFPNTTSSYATVITGIGFGMGSGRVGTFGRNRSFGSVHTPRPGVFVAPASPRTIGTMPRGQVNRNPFAFPRFPRANSPIPNFGFAYYGPPAGVTFPWDLNDRSDLITQFNQLAATRAGLAARWRELEDEARRAGAPPGWLRP